MQWSTPNSVFHFLVDTVTAYIQTIKNNRYFPRSLSEHFCLALGSGLSRHQHRVSQNRAASNDFFKTINRNWWETSTFGREEWVNRVHPIENVHPSLKLCPYSNVVSMVHVFWITKPHLQQNQWASVFCITTEKAGDRITIFVHWGEKIM